MIICHQDGLEILKQMFVRHDPTAKRLGMPYAEALFKGENVRTSLVCPRHPKKWEFPNEPLVDYEPTDEIWCRYFGIGCERDDTTQAWFGVVQDRTFRIADTFS